MMFGVAVSFQERGELLQGLLARFVSAPAEQRDHALEELYGNGIEPRATAILRSKLRVSMRADDDSYLNQIALDLLGDVRAALLPVVQRLISDPDAAAAIANFDGYVRTAVMNVYHQYIREKYPRRLSLRNRIQYILSHRPSMAIWKGRRDSLLCGTNEFDGLEPISRGELEAIADAIDLDQLSSDENTRLIAVVEELLARAGRPIQLQDLVATVWRTTGLTEREHIPVDEAKPDTLVSSIADARSRYDDLERIEHLWSLINEMPVRHRRALLLNLTDGCGDNLIMLFPALGVASIRRIAEVLEFEPAEFAEIWLRLPLDDLTIAAKMGLTRQQVINLRHTAREKLRRAHF